MTHGQDGDGWNGGSGIWTLKKWVPVRLGLPAEFMPQRERGRREVEALQLATGQTISEPACLPPFNSRIGLAW